MTFLLQQMSNTVVAAVDRGTNNLADWTILPKKGIFREFQDKHPRLSAFASGLSAKMRRNKGKKNTVADSEQQRDQRPALDPAASRGRKTLETSAAAIFATTAHDVLESEHDFAHHLSHAIQRVAADAHRAPQTRYAYSDWVHFTRLIRFSRHGGALEQVEAEEAEEGLIEWDWIGEDSPIVSDSTEPQWVLDRLCESLRRYARRQAKEKAKGKGKGKRSASGSGSAVSSGGLGGGIARPRVSFPDRIDEMEDERGDWGTGTLTETSSLSMGDITTNSRLDGGGTSGNETEEVERWAEKIGSKPKDVDG